MGLTSLFVFFPTVFPTHRQYYRGKGGKSREGGLIEKVNENNNKGESR